MEDSVRIEKNGPVMTIILSRKHARNAVDKTTAIALASAFRSFEEDQSAKVAVFWGEHGTFCSGADLKAMATNETERINQLLPVVGQDEGPMGPSRFVLSKPTIAAISGYAVAGGLELSLLCDLRVVEEDSIMGVFCRRWGVPLIDGGTVRLPRLIGLSRALDLIITGRAINSKEALDIGLANRVVKKGSSRIEAENLALEISKFPQLCLNGDRLSAYEQHHLSFQDALKNEFMHGLKAIQHGSLQGTSEFLKGSGRGGDFSYLKAKL